MGGKTTASTARATRPSAERASNHCTQAQSPHNVGRGQRMIRIRRTCTSARGQASRGVLACSPAAWLSTPSHRQPATPSALLRSSLTSRASNALFPWALERTDTVFVLACDHHPCVSPSMCRYVSICVARGAGRRCVLTTSLHPSRRFRVSLDRHLMSIIMSSELVSLLLRERDIRESLELYP